MEVPSPCASSPDSKPLDYSIRSLVDRAAQRQKPEGVGELKVAAMMPFSELDQSVVQAAVAQFKRRCGRGAHWVQNEVKV